VEPAPGVDAFLDSPIGRFVRGPTYLVWCFDEALCGSALWGRPTEQDAHALVRLFDRDPTRDRPYDAVTDTRDLEVVDPAGFAVLADYLRRRMPEYARRVRRHALIHPAGLTGASVAGLFSVIGPTYAWRLFADDSSAFAWIEHPDAGRAVELVRALVAGARSVPDALRALREHLASNLRGASLSRASRAVGQSERSLQRALTSAGTTFRQEVARSRAAAARERLEHSDAKLDAIATEVGCASASHLALLFRREYGVTPGEYRARSRKP
jgi:AraC-like DNA-binding protein